MSWKGVKKAVDRTTTTLMQKAGAMEKTVDKQFEEEEKRFKNLEVKVERLHKEAKGYLDSIRAMTIAQRRIAETIGQFFDNSSPTTGQDNLAIASQKYKQVADELDDQVRASVDAEYRETVLEPLTKFAGYFPEVEEVIKRRQKKLLDYDSLRSRIRKLAEKPSDDIDKLPKTEKQALEVKELFESINQQLIEDIPKLIDARIPYLDPSFEALLKCQLKFSTESYQKISELRPYFRNLTPSSTSNRNASSIEQTDSSKVDAVLQQMRELTIVGG